MRTTELHHDVCFCSNSQLFICRQRIETNKWPIGKGPSFGDKLLLPHLKAVTQQRICAARLQPRAPRRIRRQLDERTQRGVLPPGRQSTALGIGRAALLDQCQLLPL